MIKIKITLILFLLLATSITSWSQGQKHITISGYINDKATGETLLYANLYIENTTNGSNSNEYGFYSIDVPSGETSSIVFSYLGYQTKTIKVEGETSKTIEINLVKNNVLEEVNIIAQREEPNKEMIRSTQTSIINIPIAQIKSMPSIGGEIDIIKVIQLMPGISKGGEGGTKMFVRGGDADQNLVLLDESTVYNIGHLFGFFSVFNPDALKDITMIKGGFNANYGGRLSSVLDVRMKEGNNQKVSVKGGIGLLSSRLTVEVPIIKDKASILLSGRRTYIDKVFKAVKVPLPYYFYDLNAKVNYKISNKDRLFFSSYMGSDVLDLNKSDDNKNGNLDIGFGYKLGNFTQTLRWNHLYSPKLFSNLSLIHTKFNYDINGKLINDNVLIKSSINDYGIKLDFTKYQTTKSKIRFGTQIVNHQFRPNIINSKGDISEIIKNRKGQKLNTFEIDLYANYEYQYSEALKLNTGLRLSSSIVKDKVYVAPEPRFSATYALNDHQSFKFSYSKMNQYLHRVSSSSLSLPTDLWYPVSKNVKPQSANHFVAAYNHIVEPLGISFNTEAYYKSMNNLVEYKEGSNLLFNNNYEELLLQGKGESWGAEVLIRKQKGKINGWIGYTLSWSKRQFDQLNEGKAYWAKYDRRHQLSIVANWDISKRFTFSTVWEYSTGSRFTPLRAQYLSPNATNTGIDFIPIYAKRNAYKLSASHRLDVNLVIRNDQTKKFRSEWHIGAYNVYNRAAPYSIRVSVDDKGKLKYEQPGLFGFIPSIAYNFNF